MSLHARVAHQRYPPGLRGWEFCTICHFFAKFSTFTKIPQVPSFQSQTPVKTVFPETPKNSRKSQNTPSTNPYQNDTQFPLSSLKNATSGHARPPKSVLCPPVISGTKFRHGTVDLSNGESHSLWSKGVLVQLKLLVLEVTQRLSIHSPTYTTLKYLEGQPSHYYIPNEYTSLYLSSSLREMYDPFLSTVFPHPIVRIHLN